MRRETREGGEERQRKTTAQGARPDRYFVKSLLLVSPAVSHGSYTRTLPTVTLTRSESRSLSRGVLSARSDRSEPPIVQRQTAEGREKVRGPRLCYDFSPISMRRVAKSLVRCNLQPNANSLARRLAILRATRSDASVFQTDPERLSIRRRFDRPACVSVAIAAISERERERERERCPVHRPTHAEPIITLRSQSAAELFSALLRKKNDRLIMVGCNPWPREQITSTEEKWCLEARYMTFGQFQYSRTNSRSSKTLNGSIDKLIVEFCTFARNLSCVAAIILIQSFVA